MIAGVEPSDTLVSMSSGAREIREIREMLGRATAFVVSWIFKGM